MPRSCVRGAGSSVGEPAGLLLIVPFSLNRSSATTRKLVFASPLPLFYFFFAPRRRPRPATVRLMPLRVRALVRVRWPRVGKLRLWRKPR